MNIQPSPEIHSDEVVEAKLVDKPPTVSETVRLHDLDALRAIAMLLGILLHAGLSFVPFPWLVQDSQQTEWFGLMFSVIHGFRMPLFFMLSGFFTAMLWRKRGLAALLWHRFRRIFLPLLLSMVTIVPAMMAIGTFIELSGRSETGSVGGVWQAVYEGDTETVSKFLDDPEFDIDAIGPDGNATMLASASFLGHDELVALLIERGADVNKRNVDRGTPLHAAAFLGQWKCVRLLIENGADVNVRNRDGATPLEVAKVDWTTTKFIANLLNVEVDRGEVMDGRKKVVELLLPTGNEAGAGDITDKSGPATVDDDDGMSALTAFLIYFPIFHHLWFLWFLCWLVAAFAIYALLADTINFRGFPNWLICSPLNLIWLVPITMIPQSFMEPSVFGPDTSAGLLPMPKMLVYYAIFFFFGAFYWDCDDRKGQLGRWWFLSLPLALFIVFPIAIVLNETAFEITESSRVSRDLVFNLLQVLFAWLMTFGLMGIFRRLLSHESKTMRYVSDSSYWLYLAHLPLVLVVQWLVRDWPIPVFIKFAMVCIVVTTILLVSYEYCVRYTPIGTLLNGPRKRKPKAV